MLNPVAIFEVLFPSTEDDDRGRKFDEYRKFDSLRQYILVSQHRPGIQIFTRLDNGMWKFDAKNSINEELELESLGISIPLTEIYFLVEFPAEETRSSLEEEDPKPE